ncbi:DUF4360 domain-containing protein [Actinomadura sp. 3N508]|uniref:DUF4360 domain-containing protein n=1 Tax=Actinomadura sp. 3N508 TaxID=3375153 RepID=UPI00379981A5
MKPDAKLTTGLGVVVAALPVLAPLPASAAQPRDTPTIEIATVNGSGCRRETVTVTPGPGGFTVHYRDYSAKIGGDALPTDFRKNCQLNLRIIPPEGVTYAVTYVDHYGSAQLAPDATAAFRASHYYAGLPARHSGFSSLKGPYSGEWLVFKEFDPREFIYVPCGEDRNLTLNTELRLTASARTKTSTIDMNSDRGSTYLFAWRTCPPG